MRRLLNFAGFQLGWWGCLAAAAAGLPWVGALLVAAIVGGQWLRDGRPQRELGLYAAAAVAGYLADSALVLGGLLEFPEQARLGAPSTLWMVALWVNFAATLDSSLGWLHGRPWAAAALGGVGGPLAYIAGEALGAVRLNGETAIAMLAALWAVATPAMLWLSQPDKAAAAGLGAR